jgi:hypothetical protein
MRFRRHLLLFVAVNVVLHAINVYTGAPWWAFWPLVVWSMILLAHYLVYRARRVDERWVKERTEDVRSKSYDRAHIDSIAARRSDTE